MLKLHNFFDQFCAILIFDDLKKKVFPKDRNIMLYIVSLFPTVGFCQQIKLHNVNLCLILIQLAALHNSSMKGLVEP